MILNWNRELKKFKESNTDLSHSEAIIAFKPVWEKLKEDDKEYVQKESLEERAIKFYNSTIKGTTCFTPEIKNEFFKYYVEVTGSPITGDGNCPACITRMVKRFKKRLGL